MLLNNFQNMFSFLHVSPQTLLELKLNLMSLLVPYEYEVIDSDLAFFPSLRNVNKLVVAVQKSSFRMWQMLMALSSRGEVVDV